MIATNAENLLCDFEDVVRLFYHDYSRLKPFDIPISVRIEDDATDSAHVTVIVQVGDYRQCSDYSIASEPQLIRDRQRKRVAKITLYRALVETTGVNLPWGSLTGIRPTGTARMLSTEGEPDPVRALVRDFDIAPEYAVMVSKILDEQEGFYSTGSKDAALYIHVPVCPSRCYYCSFVSELEKNCASLDAYSDCLAQDVADTADALRKGGYRVTSVYMGGGTPTVFTAAQLQRVLSAVPEYGVEFTVEGGRPDTITEEKLDVMLAARVTRISVNPQTFHDRTLRRIGRNHSVQDTLDCFAKVRAFPFAVNMDLIVGLDGETVDDVLFSAESAVKLRPENVTLHTLCKKRGSDVYVKNLDFRTGEADAVAMMTGSQRILDAAGYRPYYLYRQKSMLAGLHNVGYALDDFQCRNNIDTMEEHVSVAACGSGAISKRLNGQGTRISRFSQVKPIALYMQRFREMLEHKRTFLLDF